MPKSDAVSALLCVMSSPSLISRPTVGCSKPATIMRKVVFPEPERAEQGQKLATADIKRHIFKRQERPEGLSDADRLKADSPLCSTPFTLRCQIMAGYPRSMLATIEEWRSLSKKAKPLLRSNLEQDRRSIMQWGAAQCWSAPARACVTPRASLSSPSDRLARERCCHAMDAAAPGGAEIELRIQDLDPLGAQCAALIRALWRRRDDRWSPPERQQIARHRHHFAIGRGRSRGSRAFSASRRNQSVQDLDAGHRRS